MRIAYVTTCKNRLEHLTRTLPQNLANNAEYPDCVFVVLDYGSDDALRRYFAHEHYHDLRSGRLVLYTLQNAGTFRMAHAKNVAHRCGLLEGAEILCSLDADNYTGPGFATWLNEHFRWAGPDSFLWSRMVPGVFARGVSGRICVVRQTYLKAGGYDESFEDWGPDDRDFIARLERAGYVSHEVPAQFLLGIRHGDGLRFNEYPHARPKDADSYAVPLPVDASTPNVANAGYFGCGVVFRNFDHHPVQLAPRPNRVFGIGMHKTGTASLAKAVSILGFDCAHWGTPRAARDLWEQVRATGRAQRIDRHLAAVDLPLPLIYRELDEGYPHSKFILTTRDEDDWLRSVEAHWGSRNSWRASWDEDCFTHRVHQELYGRKNFDPNVMLARYRQHNEEVRAYFRKRPQDLMTLDMDSAAGWPKLCQFLGVAAPSEPYPRENVTPEG